LAFSSHISHRRKRIKRPTVTTFNITDKGYKYLKEEDFQAGEKKRIPESERKP
jgi:hypothetical protein